MAISRQRIENRLRPILTAKLNKEILDMLVAEDFIEVFNEVAEDLNNKAFLRLERWYKETGADTAEDDNKTNYLVQRKIVKVLRIRLEDQSWQSYKWTYMDDRIAFNKAVNGSKLDILYLGRPEEIDALTDEIDLPVEVQGEYLELLEAKLLTKFSDNGNINYQELLDYYADRARNKTGKHLLYNQGVQRQWFFQKGDDAVYDIKDQYISLDNFITDVNSNLVYSGD